MEFRSPLKSAVGGFYRKVLKTTTEQQVEKKTKQEMETGLYGLYGDNYQNYGHRFLSVLIRAPQIDLGMMMAVI